MPTDQDRYEPAYLALLRSGELAQRVRQAYQRLEMCDLCPRCCRVDRRGIAPGEVAGEGACRTGEQAVVCSYHAHFGEEAPLVGRNGSGTIFFAWCNLNCRYCQNYTISQQGEGAPVEPEELAAMMLQLQDQGCHNVNLVSPSHVAAPILAALLIAAQAGLRLPLVYNTGGYDAVDTLKLLDGVIDIYMPDMKYADAEVGRRFSGVPDYPQVNRAAVGEMHRQVGDLAMDERGIARRGLLVRPLVLPRGWPAPPRQRAFWHKRSRATPTSISWTSIAPATALTSTLRWIDPSPAASTRRPCARPRRRGCTDSMALHPAHAVPASLYGRPPQKRRISGRSRSRGGASRYTAPS
jgi:putative pyruvate formate lyase activating enzyme